MKRSSPSAPGHDRRLPYGFRGGLAMVAGLVFALATGTMTRVAFPASAAPAQTASEKSAGAVIPLTDIAAQAETASARVRDIRSQLSADRGTEHIAKQIPSLARQISARLNETRRTIAQRPGLDVLDSLEADWRRLRRNVTAFTRDLTDRLERMQRHSADLDALAKVWSDTDEAARASAAPPELLRRIETVILDITEARQEAQQRRTRALTVQGQVAAQDARIAEALAAIDRTREDVLSHLFMEDGVPAWSIARAERAEILNQSSDSFARQVNSFPTYVAGRVPRFFIHVLVLLGLAVALYRGRSRALAVKTPQATDRTGALAVFSTPVASTFLLSSLLVPWLYPEPPRLLAAALGFFALVSSVRIIRRNSERAFRSTLYALLTFYVLDQVRSLAAAAPILPRAVFLAEMFGAIVFLLWDFRRRAESTPVRAWRDAPAAYFALAGAVVAAGAFAANVFGYVTMGNLLGNALLGSAYFALILLALIQVLDSVAAFALYGGPLRWLNASRRHGALLRRRVRIGLRWLGALAWILFVLRKLLLSAPLFAAARTALTTQLFFGSLGFSVGDILAFVVTVWASFIVSRFTRFLLDEEIYPRIDLASGLPYAVSTILHYAILVVGFLIAVAALGIDMTKVTILAGAFSVGVGLGLQNIFNNFVSGIILLFERPVKIGDVIQIDDASGIVEHIGIRASTIRTTEGSEVIIPNGKLVSERVINWTLSNHRQSVALPVAVAPGPDPHKVMTLLQRAAAEHPLVAKEPPPRAMVVKLGPDSMGFEVRAWTDRPEQWMQVRSELAIHISAALAAENIALR